MAYLSPFQMASSYESPNLGQSMPAALKQVSFDPLEALQSILQFNATQRDATKENLQIEALNRAKEESDREEGFRKSIADMFGTPDATGAAPSFDKMIPAIKQKLAESGMVNELIKLESATRGEDSSDFLRIVNTMNGLAKFDPKLASAYAQSKGFNISPEEIMANAARMANLKERAGRQPSYKAVTLPSGEVKWIPSTEMPPPGAEPYAKPNPAMEMLANEIRRMNGGGGAPLTPTPGPTAAQGQILVRRKPGM